MKNNLKLILAAACFFAAIGTQQMARAATFGWSGSGAGAGTGAGTAWLTAGNWTNNLGTPTNLDLAFFGAAGSGTSIGFNFATPPITTTNIGAIVLGVGSTVDRTIGNSSTTVGIMTRMYHHGIGGGLITNALVGRTLTLAPFAGGSGNGMTNVLLASGVIEAVGNIVINTSIGEAGGARTITKTGNGILTLGAQNTYSGKMIILAGTVLIGNEDRLGTNTSGSIIADQLTLNGGTLRVNAVVTLDDTARGITLGASGGGFSPDSGQTITVSRPIVGAGNLTNFGAGTLILNTANSYSGRTVLRAGVTRAINGNSFGALPGSYVADQIILDGGILLNQDSEFNLEANRGITIASTGGRLQSGFSRPWGVNSVIAGSGILTIAGDPTPSYVRLNAANTFTNELIVNNNTAGTAWGLVAIHGSLAAGGLVRVTTNGWLLGTGVINRSVVATNGATIGGGEIATPGTLTINGSLNLTNAILSLDEAVPGAVGSGINDLLQVNGDLRLVGSVIVRPSALLGTLTAGTYRLINYTGALTGSAANLVADADGYTVSFDTSTPGQVNMTVSGTPTTVVWKGTAGPLNAPIWDVANLPNFAVGVTPSTFLQGQNVLFDNTGLYFVGAVPLTFNMVGPSANFSSLLPASVMVDTTNNVTLNNTGTAGKLSGPMSLTKRGTGALTLATANGNFPNDYTGPTTVEGGILRAGYTRAFGATNAPTIATSGGTVDLNGQSLGAEPFIASGAGVGGNGAIINLGGGQNNALRYLTLAGDTTVGGVGRWDVRDYAANNLTGARMDGEGFTLTKVGANQVSFVGTGDTDLGDIIIQQGFLNLELNSTLGRTTDEVTVMAGATLGFWGSTVFNLKWVRLDNNARLFKDNGTTTNDGPVTLLGGTAIIDVANNGGNIYQLRNVVDGPGGLAKIGAGILQLAGTNTYTGPTVVSNATLALLTNASIAGSTLVDVKSGAVLDVGTLVTPFTLGSAQTLSGAGTVVGQVVAGTGSTVLPGTSPGTLNVSSNLTLNNANLTFELNTATTEGGGVNDLINARDLTLSGVNTVNIVPLTPLTLAPYTLLRYTNTLTGGGANLSVVSGSRYTFAVDTSAANLVRITPAGAPASLVWAGGTLGSETLWNVNTTANWLNGGLPEKFFQGDAVTFNGSSAFNNVSLVGAISPGNITVNSAVDYTFGGAGQIKTLSQVSKSGLGRLTLANNNAELDGGITINAGTLRIGGGGASGSIGSTAPITNNATLVHSRSDSNGLPNVIRGSGSFTKEGAGTLALSGANLFTGGIFVNNGTLRQAGAGAFGITTGLVVNAGGQIDLAGVTPTVRSNNFTLAGSGPDGRGALINSGVSLSGNAGITNVTLTADASIGLFGPDASSFGRIDIGSGVNPLTSLLNANNFALTKLGPGALNIRVVATNFPTLIVSNGVVYGEGLDFNLATNITVYSGGQIGMFGTYRTNSSSLTLDTGAAVVNVGGNGTNVWTGPVTNLGRSVMNVTGLSGNGHIQFGNNLYGSAPISVIGGNSRAVELRANNDATFSGPWTIAATTLLRTLENGTPGTGLITNLGTIEWFTTAPATLNQAIVGSPVNGVFRHTMGAGALTFGGTVAQNFVLAQNGDLTKPMTFASGANIQSANLSVGITNFGPALGSGRLNIDPGASVTVGNFFLGDQNTQTGVVAQAGGAMMITNQLRMAHWPNNISTYTLDSGSITMTPDPVVNPSGAAEQNGGFYIGIDGVGVLTQNGGTITTPNLVLDNRATSVLGTATNTYILNGGTLILGRWGIQSPVSTYQINLGGGTIESSANWTSVLRMTLTGTNGNVIFNPAAGRTNLLGGVISGAAGLVKNGAGTLFLTNAGNDIAGTVTVNNGTLHGNGIISGNLDLAAGGTFSPGASPGVAITTNATLLGTTLMEISRSGQTLTNDRLVVIDTITFGGTLVVTNIGQSLIGGEVFDLFDLNFTGGTFASISLPALPANLTWDTSTLYIDGIIRVTGTPTIVTAPTSQVAYECDNVRFIGAATNIGPLTIQWMKNGIDILGATSPTLSLTNVQLSDAGTYTFSASNTFGGSSASATLTVLQATNLEAGLIAYWQLDEFDAGNNRTLDSTANLQHLGGIGIQSSNVIAGVRSNAFNFNGAASNFVARIHTGGEALPAYNYPASTIAMWVKGSYVGQGDRRVFVESSTNNNNPLFGIGTHSGATGPEVDIYVRNNDGSNPVNHQRGRLAAFDGNWHHIAFVDNNGSTTLYVDGNFDTNINYVRGSMTLNAVSLSGLLRGTYGVGFSGSMDDVMVWRRALKSNEVFCAMTNGLALPVIITQPAGTLAECSSNVTFNVGVNSVDPATYQWYLGVNPILDATNASLELLSVSSVNNGSYSVVVRNCAGEVLSAAAVLTVQDTLAPVLTCPANIVVECASPTGNIVTFAASAIDGCAGAVPAACMPPSGSSFTVGTVMVTCSANDSSNNTNTCTFSVMVVDTTPPAINCPPGGMAECTSPAGATVNFSVTASDTCDAGVTIVCLPPSGSVFAPGATAVNCAASDDSMNTNTCSFMVNVVDTTPPVLTCPANISVQCNTNVPPANFAGGTVSDNCDLAPVVTHVSDVASGSCPKTIVRTYRATDASGNTNDCAQTITVHDTTAPMLVCPAPVSVQCPTNVPLPDVLLVTASDNCDSSPTVTYVGDVSTGVNPTIITRTYRATDVCGNTNDCVQIITIEDTTAPSITACALSSFIVGDTNGLAIVPDQRSQIIATDNCGVPIIIQVPAPGSMISTGVHVLTFTAIDSASNTSACTATLTIVAGALPPVILAQPQDATAECSSNATFTVSVDGTPPFAYQWFFGVSPIANATNDSLVLSSVTAAQDGGYSVIITNDGGSITSRVATLTVVDTIAPSVTCPGPIHLKTTSTNGAVVSFAASASDGCTPSPALACLPASGSLFPVGLTTVICTAVDSSGNSNSCSFAVTVLLASTASLLVNQPVPDIPSLGLASVLNVSSPIGSLSDVNVTLNISNGWNGDLFAYLVHESGYAVLLNRVGRTGSNPLGYSDAGLNVTLDDQATNDIHTYRLSLFGNHSTPLAGALTNSWQPDGRAEDPALVLDTMPRTAMLSAFNGMNPNGEWVLFVEDDATGDISTLVSWGLELCGTLGVSPTITAPPQNVIVDCGSNAVFNVTATGTGPVGYHWLRNGLPIPGANAATYAINNAHPTDNATYSVIVSNAFGAVTASATLVVNEPNLPVILTQPQSVTNNVGTTVSLSVAASSCSALSYQWCFGLTPLAGETNPTLTILNVQLVNQGGYTVKVSNAGGTTTSAVAVVTVNRPPVAQNNGGATIQGQALMIQVGKLLANDTDPDGDPLTVISVTASTNGGMVALGGGKVTYMPVPAFVGTDRFSYTISDGRGGTATADVEVLVVSGSLPSLNQVSLIPTPNGFLIRFAGIPGELYGIQRAPSVTGPWTTITTQTAPLHGIIHYEDGNPPVGSGFYRTVAQ